MKKLILKLIPKPVKKMIHATIMGEVAEFTSPSTIAVYAVRGVGFVINKGTANIGDEKMEVVCDGFELGGKTMYEIAKACNPKSENGRQFSESEESQIKQNLMTAIEKMLPQEAIDKINEEISTRISNFLGL